MVRLSLVNLYLHGFTTPKIFEYDTLTSEDRWGDYFDIILANPPFMTPKGGIRPHKKFAMQANRSEVLFVDYIMEHINPTTGRAAIIVPEGIIFQSATAYKALRKLLVDKSFLYGVVSLPAGIFQPYSGVKTSILLLDISLAKKTDKVLFMKIENDGFALGAQRKELATSDLPDAVNFIKQYNSAIRNNDFSNIDFENLPLNSLVIEKSKIAVNDDYILSADRYRVIIKQNTKWDYSKLGDVCKTSSGGTPLRSHPEFYENGTIPWLKSGEVAQGYIYESEEFITEEALAMSSAKLFPVDTVLLAMYGATAGQVGILKFPATTNQAVCGIFPGEKFIPEFLYLILKSKKEYLVSQSSGGAQPNISQTIIKELVIPVPPISVQKEIVSKIDVYDKIISGAKQIVNNYNHEIHINENWEELELSNVCEDFKNGLNFSTEQVGKGIKFVNIKDVFSDGFVNTDLLDRVDVSEKEISSKKVNDDDLLFVRSSVKYEGVGFPSLVKTNGEEIVFCGFIIKCSPIKTKVLPPYLLFLLRTEEFRKKTIYLSNKANITNISQDSLKSLIVPIPTLEEQKNIIERIENEQKLVRANKEIILLFEKKIKDEINKLWTE